MHTALLLAAGMGSRLAPLTESIPKCLIQVEKASILERLIYSLQVHNFKRLVVVVGHQADSIRDFLGKRIGGMEIVYVNNPLYKTTDNIYSLWLAREAIDEPFLLLESDLIFNPELLNDMLYPDRIAVAEIQPWMNGSFVAVNNHKKISAFYYNKTEFNENCYKTVNIYSLSKMTWRLFREKLSDHISHNLVKTHYETVLADMVNNGCLSLKPVFFDPGNWHEIDTITDLNIARQKTFLQYHQKPID